LGSFNEYLSIVTILQKELRANCHSNSEKKALSKNLDKAYENLKRKYLESKQCFQVKLFHIIVTGSIHFAVAVFHIEE
jgi:hypothetical protein